VCLWHHAERIRAHAPSHELASGNLLLLSQHALEHIEGLLAEWAPLLIMNLAGEFVASRAVVHVILYSAL